MCAMSGQWAGNLKPDQLTWLFFGSGPEDLALVDGRFSSVLQVWLDGESDSPLVNSLMKPMILSMVKHQGVCFGEGWMLDKCISPMMLLQGETGIGSTPIRYTVVESGWITKTVVSVKRGDAFFIMAFNNLDRDTFSVCIQKLSKSGNFRKEAAVHKFFRCCAVCSDLRKECKCLLTDDLLEKAHSVCDKVGKRDEEDSQSICSFWSNGTWRMENCYRLSPSICEMTIEYKESKEVVDLYCDFAFNCSPSVPTTFIDVSLKDSIGLHVAATRAQYTSKTSGDTYTPSKCSNISSKVAFSCEACGSSFRTSVALKQHNLSAHHKEKKHVCQYCNKHFSQSGHRNEHERKFHLDQYHKCDICFQRFGVPSKLQRHIRAVHDNLRTHECQICHKKFKEKNHLQKHSLSHQRQRRQNPTAIKQPTNPLLFDTPFSVPTDASIQ